jgi:hypothetical protein
LRLDWFLFLAIFAYSFNRAAEQGFFTGRTLFIAYRLFEDKGVAIRVGAPEVFRRRIPTHITIYAGGIDVVSAVYILLHSIVSISQSILRRQMKTAKPEQLEVGRLNATIQT